MYTNPRPPYPNELYHHGVLGMHWGIRRFQPYRKGDQVKGGKEVGKATKVEQRSIADRVKKGIAAVNKIKKELHKGNLEKEQYKYERAQLKEAQREVKKAKRRKAEENIRERIRERREQEREDRRLEEERRDRNLERARDIASSAAQIGTMVYGAYQLKKNFDAARAADNPVSIPQQTDSVHSHSSSNTANPNPTVHTSGTGTSSSTPSTLNGTSNSTPQIHTSGSHNAPSVQPATPDRHHRIREALQSVQNSHQANQSLNSYDATSNQRLSQNIQNATQNSNRYSDAQSSIRQAIRRIDPHADFDSNGNYRSTSRSSVSEDARNRIQRLEQINDRMDTERQRAQNLAGALGSVQATYQQNQSGSGKQRRYRDKQERIKNIAQAAGMTAEQYKNASKKDQLKALAKFMTQSGSAQSQANANSDAEFMNQMRRMDNLRSHMSEDERKRLMREIEQLSHMNRYSDELYHHGVLGMHWGIRRYQPYRNGERVKGGKEIGKATKVEQRPVSYKTKFKVNRKLSKNNDKILKLRAKQYGKSFDAKNKIAKKIMKLRKKNSKLYDKAGYSNTMETEEYRREYDRVSSGGVDKTVDAAAKKAALAEANRKKNPSMQAYRASVNASEALRAAQNAYMKKTGIQRYNKDQLSQAVNSYKKATNSSKKALDDFTSKKFTKEMQNEYHTMRSTDPKFEKYRALNKELYELKTSYNNDLERERVWSDELNKLKSRFKMQNRSSQGLYDRMVRQQIADNNRLFNENAIRIHNQNALAANEHAFQAHNQHMQAFNDNHNYVNQLHTQMHINPHVDTFTHTPMF